jgi:hypothetical protein
VSAVDTPPGLGLGGLAHGAFAARSGPRRLAEYGSRITLLLGIAAIALAVRRPTEDAASLVVVGALTSMALAAVGLAVRRAQVTIGSDGVRWGWGRWTVRMDRDRIVRVDLYDDAIALRARRGSTWFLSRRDWDRFEAMRRAVTSAGLPAQEHAGRTPLAARLQSYGHVLDALIVLAILGGALQLVVIA